MRAQVAALVVSAAAGALGHATMIKPMSRAYMVKMKGNIDGSPCNSGACTEPQSAGGTGGYSPCGRIRNQDMTEDPWDLSRVSGAELADQTLTPGGVVEITVHTTAHHMGHFIFGICPDGDLTGAQYGNPPTTVPDCATISDPVLKSACQADYMSPLDTYAPAKRLMDCFMGKGEWAGGKNGAGILERSEAHEELDPAPIDPDHKDRWYLPPKAWTLPDGRTGAGWPPGSQGGMWKMYYKVPSNLKCSGGKCLLHFYYWTANSCTGQGYNKYFSQKVNGAWAPSDRCTGLKCKTGTMKNGVPFGPWAMSGDWWRGPQYDKCGTCDCRVTDSPTNTWARNSPERFWNCGDITSSGSPAPPTPPAPATPAPAPVPNVPPTPKPAPVPPPTPWPPVPQPGPGGDSCATKTCGDRECQRGACCSGTCYWEDKADGDSCGLSCGECRAAQCRQGGCACVEQLDGTACSSGTCKQGTCTSAPTPGTPSPVDCVASVSCTWSKCSKDCGGGTKTKTCTRQVTTPARNGGRSCDLVAPVPPVESDPCNTQQCPTAGKTCTDPPAGDWEACHPQTAGAPPRCCSTGKVCCGNQWWATCRSTCSSTETSFAASREGGEGGDGGSGGGVGTGLAALLGALGGLCLGGAGVMAAMKAKGSGAPAAAPQAESLGTASRTAGTTSRSKANYREQADI